MLFAFFEVPSRKVQKILRIIEFNTSLLNPYLGGDIIFTHELAHLLGIWRRDTTCISSGQFGHKGK